MGTKPTHETDASFRLTDDTGELLHDSDTGGTLMFRAADSAAGELGALHRAARKAGALQRSGRTVLLEGPGERRRYAPEYLDLKGSKRWPYRIPCSIEGCQEWIHPVQPRGQIATCREHFAKSEMLQEAGRRLQDLRRLHTAEAETTTND